MLPFLSGCKTTKINDGKPSEVWQTIMVKQLSSAVNDGIVEVKYNNNTTLFYKILDNFGNVSLTSDKGSNNYKGDIEIPSFITVGDNNEFVFRVTEIEEGAFKGCANVTSISIPFSVLRINFDAFLDCKNLKRIVVNSNNQTYKDIEGVLYSKDTKMLIDYPAKKIGTDYVIPSDVAFICPNAFKDNNYIESVTIGSNVTAISDYAFKNCANLRQIIIGESVRIIGKGAFNGCSKIEEIYSNNIFPPHNCPIVYEPSIFEKCKLYIPQGRGFHYRMTLEWKDFKNIIER